MRLMRRRLRGLTIVLVLTVWAFAGLVTLTCVCCATMGASCPGLCASSPSVVSDLSRQVPLPVHVVHVHHASRPAIPLAKVPTPPPKFLSSTA